MFHADKAAVSTTYKDQRRPNSATAFDNRRRISLKAKYLALEGHLREGAFESGARAVPAGGTTHSALGRLRGPARPALRPVREELAALAPGRVLPFAPGGSRKRGPELS
jgi:hypothetical protein